MINLEFMAIFGEGGNSEDKRPMPNMLKVRGANSRTYLEPHTHLGLVGFDPGLSVSLRRSARHGGSLAQRTLQFER